MPEVSRQSVTNPFAGTVALGDYLGRPQPRESSSWSRSDQLTARFDWYGHMRKEQPVARNPETGVWGIFRHSDVRRSLTDVKNFCSFIPGLPPENPLADSMLRVDPPRHGELRGLISQAFTSRRIAGLRQQIQDLCAELVDGASHGNELDVVVAIAQVLPTLVISDLLDIDPSLRQDFQRWTAAYMKSFAVVLDEKQLAALREMQQFFASIIAERRRGPGTDLISAAVTAEMAGMHLTDRDLLQFANLLLIAGSETTTHLITNTVLCVQQHPDLADRIRVAPAILPAVIDEVLRYLSPVQTAPRAAAADIVMYDQVIPAGSMVFPWLGAANRDPDEFDEPDTFSIDRKRGKHLAFGHGIHFCLGAALARLETEVVLTTMLARLPGRWDVPDVLSIFPAQEMCGLASLPLRWEKAAANGR